MTAQTYSKALLSRGPGTPPHHPPVTSSSTSPWSSQTPITNKTHRCDDREGGIEGRRSGGG
eukprot:1735950-Rhodomonas_salina.1